MGNQHVRTGASGAKIGARVLRVVILTPVRLAGFLLLRVLLPPIRLLGLRLARLRRRR